MMQFWGGGVGHKTIRNATNFFKRDRDQLDTRPVTTADVNKVMAKEAELQLDKPENANTKEDEKDDFGYNCYG